MNHRMIAVVLAALPAVALSQSNALDQARGAGAVQQAGTDGRAAAAIRFSRPANPCPSSGATMYSTFRPRSRIATTI